MKNVHRFRRTDLAAQPWKNGGGLTREVMTWPPGASLTDFDWRVSIAHIVSSGPFSVYSGVDRVITLLEGAGVVLHSLDGKVNHRLDQPFRPFCFAGELEMQADLLGADCHDFNVMTRRAAYRASVQVLTTVVELPLSSQGLVFAAAGDWTVNGQVLRVDEGLWWNDKPHDMCNMQPHSQWPALIAVQIETVT